MKKLLLIFLLFLNAWSIEFPKIYSSLGNKLFDVNVRLQPFLTDFRLGLKVYDFNQHSEQICQKGIYLDSQKVLNPIEAQSYLLSLRVLEKEYQEISYLLHQKLLHSIKENDYENFYIVFITIPDEILARNNLREEVINFYRKNRNIKTIPLLETMLTSSTSSFEKLKKMDSNETYTLKHIEGDKIELSMWQDNVDTVTIQLEWKEAIEYCQNLNLGGFDDWILPDKNNLFKFLFAQPELKYHTEDLYWSASEESNLNAYRVFFDYNIGGISPYNNITSNPKNEKWYVRCYRRIR